MSRYIILRDAGHREQAWAQHLVDSGQLPKDVTFEDMLSHAVYDPHDDTIYLTIRGVPRAWRVQRP